MYAPVHVSGKHTCCILHPYCRVLLPHVHGGDAVLYCAAPTGACARSAHIRTAAYSCRRLACTCCRQPRTLCHRRRWPRRPWKSSGLTRGRIHCRLQAPSRGTPQVGRKTSHLRELSYLIVSYRKVPPRRRLEWAGCRTDACTPCMCSGPATHLCRPCTGSRSSRVAASMARTPPCR